MKKIILDVFSLLVVIFSILALIVILGSTEDSITLGLQFLSASIIISVFLALSLYHLFKHDKK